MHAISVRTEQLVTMNGGAGVAERPQRKKKNDFLSLREMKLAILKLKLKDVLKSQRYCFPPSSTAVPLRLFTATLVSENAVPIDLILLSSQSLYPRRRLNGRNKARSHKKSNSLQLHREQFLAFSRVHCFVLYEQSASTISFWIVLPKPHK
ncbi:hypothetical protein TGME49_261770 [Toxoplasma gondii ME49]|uniref:Uncharacterized protein n=9 Tax=Toxoplasma gondii TaxID=5811 RepID=A0A125YVP7_TOXGV|nr:hypothetical protein TGME49_261770 [Toxoplasma gondii ME49]EPR62698.1 hypothetical protein TGGT1_261770 [Toxoplasma gondii GT1]ESS31992.1 hypothetical protein TGVEG_261770 [Toxoplasma gondii VEG]KFG49430.1 hypothetical protein TGDOM2_261770 [Toxoplasma gondii GAB2-2007-GAL-DOM2]KFG52735.1 hypothetical protein TGFOU_261770 [Toxoplasma gondii FOU]KYF40604.1 hypothetical protein TGARI_261770 [Toxoplasma gondii ARI]PUA89737.1 hypothetical protein TGBR9_261770 [Toxoplasma gondii TgCATBr9]RQX71|eukprot:XP_002365309.2 hypothetical protein TGME49_261770 [Toxoplasma gondii ME49]